MPALRVQIAQVVAFAEGRVFNCNDHGAVDIVARLSADAGKTWGPTKKVNSAAA